MITDNGPQQSISSDRSGKADRDGFERLAEPYRRELKLHCYRMLGSVHEAEDLVQETYLRAWRGFGGFEGRGSLRGWLYRIATNASLNALARRARTRRVLPELQTPPSTGMPEGKPATDIAWLEPYPNANLKGIADEAPGPDARFEMREAVRLAFVAAIQHLPPKQRAVLLLRDVMGWSAAETALLLDVSVASVNSALQRARAKLSRRYPNGRVPTQPPNDQQRVLLDRYVQAWENTDLDRFVSLLREDAIYTMPPWQHWYLGREAIRAFFESAWKSYDAFRLVSTGANGQPAFGIYSRGKLARAWQAHSIQLIEFHDDTITALTQFVRPLGPRLFATFGLPSVMSDKRASPRQPGNAGR